MVKCQIFDLTAGVLAPTLIQLEEEIDRELAQDSKLDIKVKDRNLDKCEKQIITNDLKSLHERVRIRSESDGNQEFRVPTGGGTFVAVHVSHTIQPRVHFGRQIPHRRH